MRFLAYAALVTVVAPTCVFADDFGIQRMFGQKTSIAEVTFAAANIPADGQKRWRWRGEAANKLIETVAFRPNEKAGWDELRELDHPGQLLQNAEIYAQMETLIGQDFDAFQQTLNGVGSGSFEGDDWFGQSCTPHMCTDEEAIIFLSVEDREIYAAFRPSGEKIIVWPAVNEWPEKAKRHLRAWAEQWK
jgi:hypothetical protein